MELHELKKELQNHFTDGLVIIVGCGLSSAEGIPGMSDLAQHLKIEIPNNVKDDDLKLWDKILEKLEKGETIEQALLEYQPTPELEKHIIELTAGLILKEETKIINEIFEGTRILRFTHLLNNILKPSTGGIPVVTTNYDRLLEIASEMAGLGADTLFAGQHYSILNEKKSRMSFCRNVSKKGNHVYLSYTDRVVILKPHGSLDWYFYDNKPIRCPLPLNQPRLIITPGINKFRNGYDRPFDKHREKANTYIDSATRYLILGYGFNDDHLETHLTPELKEGKPSLLLTHSLTANAKKLIKECEGMITITAGEKDGAHVIRQDKDLFFAGPNLWDLGVFIKEVLEP
ncbi:MAG: SIR2 family protein [Nitrospirota bacterium]